jgi:hypothetical protein
MFAIHLLALVQKEGYTNCDVSFLSIKISQQHEGITAIYISFHISTILYIFENICSFRYSSLSSYICT